MDIKIVWCLMHHVHVVIRVQYIRQTIDPSLLNCAALSTPCG